MNHAILTTIAITGFSVAFLHAAIPTHWLPFVLTARAQNWSRAKTLAVTALAGSGHVLFTALLGFLVAIFGIALSHRLGALFPWIAGGALILFGLYYIVEQLRGRGHSHFHHHFQKAERLIDHADEGKGMPPKTSDSAAIVGLIALLTFSPCEGFLPVYASGVRFGWIGFVLLSAILCIGAVSGMLLFTSLTLAGMEKMKLAALECYESAAIGTLLCLLGMLVIFIES